MGQRHRTKPMDYPFLVGFVILGAVWLIGATVERFRTWAMPAAALATIALIAETLWLVLR